MDMAMDMGDSDITLQDPNLLWAGYLSWFFLAIIIFLSIRRIILMNTGYSFLRSTLQKYSYIDRLVVNKLSYNVPIGLFLFPSVGMILLLLSFFGVVLTLLLYNDNLFVNANRAGFLALAIIPFSFAFAGKNSALTLLTGFSHEKLNIFHRWIGRTMFALVTVHMACQISGWAQYTWFLKLQLQDPKVQYGLAAYSVLGVIFVTSLRLVRLYLYRFFLVSHSLFLVFIVLIAIHTPYAMRFTFTGIILYIFDQLIGWTIKAHMAYAKVHILEDNCTKLIIATELRHRPGQHIYLWVPSISKFEWHPFTISSISTSAITLNAQVVGKFTRSLNNVPQGTEMHVAIAGPYGEPPNLSGAKSILLMAGGSGASFTIPILLDLARKAFLDEERDVSFVWCIRKPVQITWFQRELELALSLTENTHIKLSIQIHISSGVDSISDVADWGLISELPKFFESDSRICLIRERMHCHSKIENAVQAAEKSREIVHVIACGPNQLLRDITNAVANHTHVGRNPIKLYCESFGC